MLLSFYLLFTVLHISEGCTLENTSKTVKITAHRGGSVLLPCYCTDPNTKPERFSWAKLNTKTNTLDTISSERDRVQLVNDHSPANLSLLILHLTEEDGGDYWCDAENGVYVFIKLTIKGSAVLGGQTTPTPSVTASSRRPNAKHSSLTPTEERPAQNPATSMYFLTFMPVLLLLLGIGGVIYWKYRGQRRGQMESKEQRGRRSEQDTKDQVMYSTIVHSNTTRTPTVTNIGDNIEYATIRMN